jgi:hypothetical protein
MRNHDQKIKDISRSVLPSTGRRSARDNRRIIHKQQRARELAELLRLGVGAVGDGPTADAAIADLRWGARSIARRGRPTRRTDAYS